ncbi:MAG TPA: hypothetical protein VF665_18015 [Longimicrobium sp.]|jgi:hypothetical protein|uniref:hypothetical protein n=1 Tax=Longimicrobium sp. TaxID=2029185 RepID=UPI002EDA1750
MQSRFLQHVLSLGVLLLAAACADSPTAPSSSPEPVGMIATNAAVSPQGTANGLTSLPCWVQIPDGFGGFRSRESVVNFPESDLHLSGRRRMYQYRGYAGDSLVFEATCVIPATENAARRMDRIFRVQRSPEKTLSLMSEEDPCGKAGCLLNPITVTACVGGNTYPNCDEKPEDHDQCYDFGICGSDSGTGWTGGSTGGGGGDPAATSPYEQGPLTFAACVLAVTGSVYTINQVGNLFTEWWAAQKDYESAKRILDAIYANPGSVSQATVEVYELRLDLARQRLDAAIGAVKGGTDMTGFALLGAAVACGASAFLPTP